MEALPVHLQRSGLRNSFRFVPRQHRDEMAKDLRPIYTAPTEPAAKAKFDELAPSP